LLRAGRRGKRGEKRKNCEAESHSARSGAGFAAGSMRCSCIAARLGLTGPGSAAPAIGVSGAAGAPAPLPDMLAEESKSGVIE
jgi:hypothetical protein